MVPEHEEFFELSSRTYANFDEQRVIWAQDVRNLPTGHALLRLVDDPKLHRVLVRRSVPGYLRYDIETLSRRFPHIVEQMDRLIEENFQSDIFVSANAIDRKTDRRLERVLHPPITLQTHPSSETESDGAKTDDDPRLFI